MVAVRERPHPWCPDRAGSRLQDAADRFAVTQDIVVIIAPLPRWATGGCALEDQLFFHGRVAQRMSADFLHRRMHVRIVSRSPTRRVNWAGAQRRLLSDRPDQPVRIVLSTLRQINAGMAYWGACLASNQDV